MASQAVLQASRRLGTGLWRLPNRGAGIGAFRERGAAGAATVAASSLPLPHVFESGVALTEAAEFGAALRLTFELPGRAQEGA
eukprot:gene1706-15141_t